MAKGKKKTLQQQLREQAEVRLEKMLMDAEDALKKVVKGSPVEASQLAKIIVGGRVASVRKAAISSLASKAEADLVKLYNKQADIEDADEEKVS